MLGQQELHLDCENDLALLRQILGCPLGSAEPVLEFAQTKLEQAGRPCVRLPGNCLYSPGTRSDAVVMVAHADTVWNNKAGADRPTVVAERNGAFESGDPDFGIGADDRAGVAMILSLAALGHSILITDLEENHQEGARMLRQSRCPEFESMQQHRFFVQFDRRGTGDYKCYDVGTDPFRRYIESKTGLREPNRTSRTDILELCRDIPGVNVSVGYSFEHTPREMLNIQDWCRMQTLLAGWLGPGDETRFTFSADPDSDTAWYDLEL